jgi:hypothetical protein
MTEYRNRGLYDPARAANEGNTRPSGPDRVPLSLALSPQLQRPQNIAKHETDMTYSIGRKFGLDHMHSRKVVDSIAHRYDLPRDLALEYVGNNEVFGKSFSRQLRSDHETWDPAIAATIGDAEKSHVIEYAAASDDNSDDSAVGATIGVGIGQEIGGAIGKRIGLKKPGRIIGGAIGGWIGDNVKLPTEWEQDRIRKRAKKRIRHAEPPYP